MSRDGFIRTLLSYQVAFFLTHPQDTLLNLALVLKNELNMLDVFGIYVSMLMLRYPKDTRHLKALLLGYPNGCPSETSKCYNTTECRPWTLKCLNWHRHDQNGGCHRSPVKPIKYYASFPSGKYLAAVSPVFSLLPRATLRSHP